LALAIQSQAGENSEPALSKFHWPKVLSEFENLTSSFVVLDFFWILPSMKQIIDLKGKEVKGVCVCVCAGML
jgi:hypothetical protein